MIKKSKVQKEIDRKNALRLIDSLYFYNVITIGYENNIAKVKYQTIQEEIHKVLSKFEVYENEYAYYEHYIVFFLEIVLSYKQRKYDNENALSDANITREQMLKFDQFNETYDIGFILGFIEIKNDKVDSQKLLEIIDDLSPKLAVMEYSFYEITGLVKKYYSYCYETSSIDFYIYLNHLGIIESNKVKIKKMDIDSFIQNNQYFLIRTFLLMEFEMIKNYLAANMGGPTEDEARKIIDIRDTFDFLNELRKVKGFGSQLNITEIFTGIAAKNIDGIGIIKPDSYNCISEVSIFIEKYVSILSTPSFFMNMISQVIGYFGKALYLKYSKLEGENKNTVEERAKKASSFLRNEKGLIISGKSIESNYQFTLHKEFRKVEYYVYNQQIKDHFFQEKGLNLYNWKSPDYTYYSAYCL